MRALNCPIVALGLACIHASLYAQDAPPIVDAQPLDVDASISAVTLYPGRAAVTRHTSVSLHSGAFDLRFNNLPETIQSDTLQARTDSGLRVLSVEYEQRAVADVATSPAVVELDSRIKSLMQSLRAMTDERELIKSQDEFLAALTIRTTSDAADAGGTAKLDLDAVKNQMEFITAERKRLQVERAALDTEQPKIEAELAAAKANRDAAVGRGSVARTAVVSVVAPDTFNGEVALTYLVANATWEPAYNIRAAGDLSSVQIEYDAMLTQRTGEDWDDVRLTLSTATPTIAANPPAISPFFVDIWRPEQLARGRGGESHAAPATDAEAGFRGA
ncbi:MAG TPA: mucoidy inhibitor MuiA family protein, partial [Phycisphaerales bacterium]|nr:mucoidy inhibitor MuiA family protein [Phycisphaerales bacterium]